MQHTHRLLLVIRGARFHDRTDKHFQKSASDRICHDRDQDPGKRDRQQFRQKCEHDQTRRRKNMRRDHARTVSDPVHKADREQIDQQLYAEVKSHQQRDLR